MVEIINSRGPNERIKFALGFALLITFVEAFAQWNVKKSSSTENDHRLFLAMVLYCFVVYLLFRSYKYENVGHMNLIWSCMSIIVAFISGYVCFGEPFNKYTVVAILFALFAIYFAHRADE